MYLKRISLYIIIAWFLSGTPGYGQCFVTGPFAKQMPRFQKLRPIHVSLALRNRVERTYLQALQAQQLERELNWYAGLGATERILSEDVLLDEEVYATTDFLTTNKQRAKYFLTRQNRETIRQIPFFQNYAVTIREHLDKLRQHMHDLSPAPLSLPDASSLTAVISPKTSYFLLGEIHNVPAIRNQVINILQALRTKHPKKQIFLFTEFLPKEQTWQPNSPNTPFENYLPVWQAAYELNIPVIGLDPQYVFDNLTATIELESNSLAQLELTAKAVNMWTTLEGIRLRNKDWLSTLKKYREQYPQALFIVYGGAVHFDYAFPFSIGQSLAGPSTHVTILQPEKARDRHGNLTNKFSLFDQVSDDHFTQYQLVRITHKKLAKLAGFDTRWRVPTATHVFR